MKLVKERTLRNLKKDKKEREGKSRKIMLASFKCLKIKGHNFFIEKSNSITNIFY